VKLEDKMIRKSSADVAPIEMMRSGFKGMHARYLWSTDDGPQKFAMRLMEFEPYGHTSYHKHLEEHQFYFLEGEPAYVGADGNEIRLDGQSVKLTSTESKLLYYLINNEGRLLSHENLLRKIWGETYVDARDLLRVHIQHLRQKLGDSVESPNIITTEHGMGYKFVRPVTV